MRERRGEMGRGGKKGNEREKRGDGEGGEEGK